jgi:hypothetical protein
MEREGPASCTVLNPLWLLAGPRKLSGGSWRRDGETNPSICQKQWTPASLILHVTPGPDPVSFSYVLHYPQVFLFSMYPFMCACGQFECDKEWFFEKRKNLEIFWCKNKNKWKSHRNQNETNILQNVIFGNHKSYLKSIEGLGVLWWNHNRVDIFCDTVPLSYREDKSLLNWWHKFLWGVESAFGNKSRQQ